jgi:hypothetical protein
MDLEFKRIQSDVQRHMLQVAAVDAAGQQVQKDQSVVTITQV